MIPSRLVPFCLLYISPQIRMDSVSDLARLCLYLPPQPRFRLEKVSAGTLFVLFLQCLLVVQGLLWFGGHLGLFLHSSDVHSFNSVVGL
jgi:hypothetical protein